MGKRRAEHPLSFETRRARKDARGWVDHAYLLADALDASTARERRLLRLLEWARVVLRAEWERCGLEHDNRLLRAIDRETKGGK